MCLALLRRRGLAMPYDESTGRVHAPVGLASVALALREPLTDTATLCCSEKINPYSLIRPLYASKPNVSPVDYGSWQSGHDTPKWIEYVQIPTSLKPKNNVNISFALGSTNYTTTINYEQKLWGYWVPWVYRHGNIGLGVVAAFFNDAFIWKRITPRDAMNLAASERSFGCLAMFDGYVTDRNYPPVMANVTMEYGKQLNLTIVNPFGGTVSAADSALLNDSGTKVNNHHGGVVNIPAVFGDIGSTTNTGKKIVVGVSLFRAKNGKPAAFIKAAWTDSADATGKITAGSSNLGHEDEDREEDFKPEYDEKLEGGKPIQGPNLQASLVTTGTRMLESGEFVAIPWLCVGDPMNGGKIFPLRYAADMEWYHSATIVPRIITVVKTDVKVTGTTGTANFSFRNDVPKEEGKDYTFKVFNCKLEVFKKETNGTQLWKNPVKTYNLLLRNLKLQNGQMVPLDSPEGYCFQSSGGLLSVLNTVPLSMSGLPSDPDFVFSYAYTERYSGATRRESIRSTGFLQQDPPRDLTDLEYKDPNFVIG